MAELWPWRPWRNGKETSGTGVVGRAILPAAGFPAGSPPERRRQPGLAAPLFGEVSMMIVRILVLGTLFGAASMAQPPDFGFGGRGFGPGGRGGPGGPMGGTRKVLDQFDKDKKGYLNAVERKAA